MTPPLFANCGRVKNKMGCWGLGSDENDWTWDDVGLGIMERASGFELNALGRSADGLVKAIVEDSGPGVLNRVGAVIFLLKQGCTVPLTNLAIVRKKLVEENHKEMFPDDAEERKLIVSHEIAIIDAAAANGGVVPGPPIGVRPITMSNVIPVPFNLNFRRHDADLMWHENERRALPQAGATRGRQTNKAKKSAKTKPASASELLVPDKTKCADCGKNPGDLLQCSRCHAICYCNRDCQVAHYSAHKKPCKKYAASLASGTAAGAAK